MTSRLISKAAAEELDLRTRIRIEAEITDFKKRRILAQDKTKEFWTLDQYRHSSPWSNYMFDFLGDLRGMRVFDLGCGYHPTPLFMARAGARHVYACDVSLEALAYMRSLAEKTGLADRISFLLCAGEELPLPDRSIDRMHGEAVLHHLRIQDAVKEIRRILSPGGRAVFKDPLGENPVLEFARDHLRAKKTKAKATDKPMSISEIRSFGSFFSGFDYRTFNLLAMVPFALGLDPGSRPFRLLTRLDEGLMKSLPSLQHFCQYSAVRISQE